METKEMQDYELTVIFKPDYAPEALNTLRDLIVMMGGEIEQEGDDGVKRLSYPITKDDEEYSKGCYVWAALKLPRGKARDLEKETNAFPTVLRYLLVSVNRREK